MAKVIVIRSYSCLSCGAVEKEMTFVGPMVFCRTCAWKIFDINAKTLEVPADTAEYKKWLNIYRQKN